MALHLTKVAFGAQHFGDITDWFRGRPHLDVHTRYRPTRWQECLGGSLFWIHRHNLVGRSPILRFEEAEGGKTHIVLANSLIEFHPQPRRAHQGWRYLDPKETPRDLPKGRERDDALPPALAQALAEMGLR